MSAKNSLLLFLVPLLFLLAQGNKTQGQADKEFDWGTFIIGSSCMLETSESEECGKCFDQLDTAAAKGKGPEVVANCSALFLTNITARCEEELGAETDFEVYWEGVLECFYGYVTDNDKDGKVQTEMKKWMKKQEEKFDWGTFIIGSSCMLETSETEECGTCFDQLDTAAAKGKEPEVVANCTAVFLPNIAAKCEVELVADTDLEVYWEGVLECFYGYVTDNDKDGKVQTEMKKWMKQQAADAEDADTEKKWEFLIGASCMAESKSQDGSFNDWQAQKCGECFGHLPWSLDQFRSCSLEFLASMASCATLLEEGEWEALECFGTKLEMVDPDGEARRRMEDWMQGGKGWMDVLQGLVYMAWNTVAAWWG